MSQGQGNWPELKCKAHNGAMVCRWLASFCNDFTEDRSVEFTPIRVFLRSHCTVQDIMASADAYFTADQAQEFLCAGNMMLRAWARLSRRAEIHGAKRWQLKPKHHHWEEGLYRGFETRVNPRHKWAYKHESFIGMIAKVAARVHVSQVSGRTAQRWSLRFTKSLL